VGAPRAGCVAAVDTRALGLAVVELGGGRRHSDERIDPAVGLSALAALGARVEAGSPLARVHAANPAAADTAAARVRAAYMLADAAPAATSLVAEHVTPEAT
jgi:thymidine phosphorylase